MPESNKASHLSFFQELLRMMVKRRATDLYLVVGSPPLVRASNALHQLIDKPISAVIIRDLIRTITDASVFEKVDKEGDVNFATSFPGVARFRINIYKQRGSYCLVAHFITTRVPEFDDFDIHPGVRSFVHIHKGLVMIAGEGGSGRSTTTAAILNQLRQNFSFKIITLEDPIEFVYKHSKSIVCQREYGTDFFDWESALRNCLRQSPDVVSIGEIDSYPKLLMAMRISASGRLCLASIVATNVTRVFGMLENLTPEEERIYLRQQLSRAVVGISCQKQVRTSAGQTMAAFEVMITNPFIVSLMNDGEYKSIREYLSKEAEGHNQTIDDHLIELYQKGMIDKQDAIQRAETPEDVKMRLRTMDKPGQKLPTEEAALSLARDGNAMSASDEAFL